MDEKLLHKILIVGPFSDFGGRELETGFIANVLSKDYKVTILTTGSISSKSQVFEFNKNQMVLSLKKMICKKFKLLNILAFISYLKNYKEKNLYYFVNNRLAKKYLNYSERAKKIISEVIKEHDVIFINAQITSDYVRFIISCSKKYNKKIIFRTTGKINNCQDLQCFNDVDLFIHHTEKNAEQLKISRHKYIIIDQCAFNEEELLKVPLLENKVSRFLTLGRLEKEKNIDIVLKSFLKMKSKDDILYILGDGLEKDHLVEIADNDDQIVFTGFIPNDELQDYFSKVDCVIISHYDFETGPLTGIEAMAGGRLIITAKTGAMPERLEDIDSLWFDNSIESLTKSIQEVKQLNNGDVSNRSSQVRNRYIEKYSKNVITSQYQKAVENVLK